MSSWWTNRRTISIQNSRHHTNRGKNQRDLCPVGRPRSTQDRNTRRLKGGRNNELETQARHKAIVLTCRVVSAQEYRRASTVTQETRTCFFSSSRQCFRSVINSLRRSECRGYRTCMLPLGQDRVSIPLEAPPVSCDLCVGCT